MAKFFLTLMPLLCVFVVKLNAQWCQSTCIKPSIPILHDSVEFQHAYKYLFHVDFYNSCSEPCKLSYPYTGNKSDNKKVYFEMYEVKNSDTSIVKIVPQDIQYLPHDPVIVKPNDKFRTTFSLFHLFPLKSKGTYLFKGFYKSNEGVYSIFTESYIEIIVW